jgi:hypothetical protein
MSARSVASRRSLLVRLLHCALLSHAALNWLPAREKFSVLMGMAM